MENELETKLDKERLAFLIESQKKIKDSFQDIRSDIVSLCLRFQELEISISEYNNVLDTYFSETLEAVHLDIKALDFDLHTTRQERDAYRSKLEGE